MNLSLRVYLLIFSVLISGALSAQQGERLYDLQTNPNANNNSAKKQLKATNGGYIYFFDTLDISIASVSFKDDFSVNRTMQYDAQPTDAGVKDTTFYHLYIAGLVANDTVRFRSDTTYHIMVNMADTTYDSIPLPDITLELRDMSVYPNIETFIQAWPSYNIWDTIAGGLDTIFLNPNHVQDSLLQYLVQPDLFALWMDEDVYINSNYPINPPTVGVATFDGVDYSGYPYDWSSASTHGVADYLTSIPLDMSANQGSTFLSFYVQAQGLGNAPQPQDSLVLEFLNKNTGDWDWQWSQGGSANTAFALQMIEVFGTEYLYNGFQFRFKNYATLSANADHWHLDYVWLDDNRTIAGTDVPQDVGFIYSEYALTKTYTAIPWAHYQNNPSSFMVDNITTDARNLGSVSSLIQNGHMIIKHNGNIIEDFTDPDAPTVTAYNTYTTTHEVLDAPNSFQFDPLIADTCASFEVTFTTGANPDFNNYNDTIRFTQTFFNYYAYDDGSSESGYGLIGDGSTLAYGFTTQIPDTIRAIAMYFNPFVDDVQNEAFRLRVWDASGAGGTPGNELYTGFTNHNPVYNSTNGYYEYVLATPIVVSGTFYIGWLQVTAERLNIGFDLTNDNSDQIFYDIGSGWTNTSFSGSLMMRPVFKSDKDYLLTAEEAEPMLAVSVYPNPTRAEVNIVGLDLLDEVTVEVLDLSGRRLFSDAAFKSQSIDLSSYDSGIYLLRISDNNTGAMTTERIVLQR